MRGPKEPEIKELKDFYNSLITIFHLEIVSDGNWKLLKCFSAWESNYTFDSFIIYSWNNSGGDLLLICVNYADSSSQCYVKLPFEELKNQQWQLKDLMNDISYD